MLDFKKIVVGNYFLIPLFLQLVLQRFLLLLLFLQLVLEEFGHISYFDSQICQLRRLVRTQRDRAEHIFDQCDKTHPEISQTQDLGTHPNGSDLEHFVIKLLENIQKFPNTGAWRAFKRTGFGKKLSRNITVLRQSDHLVLQV